MLTVGARPTAASAAFGGTMRLYSARANGALGRNVEVGQPPLVVHALRESDLSFRRPSRRVQCGGGRDRRLERLWPAVLVQRHVAAGDQHEHHHRHVLDGVPDPKHQNRDSEAMQIKLDELIRVTQGANAALLDLEELDDDELDATRDEYEKLARE